VKIVRKYAHATESSNLKNDAFHHDTDTLAAVALSDRQFGSLLFRVKYSNDASSYKRLQEEWRWDVKKRAALDGWPEHVKDQAVADHALKYWLNDICPACGGKGVKKMEFVDVLSDEPCDICEGSGKKSIQCPDQIRRFVQDMVNVLEGMTIAAGGVAIAKLARDFEL
jgi:hypothetical protein